MKAILFFAIIAFVGCQPKYKGFESFNDSIHYKLTSFSENEEYVRDSSSYLFISYMFCSNEICNEENSIYTNCASTQIEPEFWSKFSLGDEFVLLLDSGIEEKWIKLFQLEDNIIHWPVISKVSLISSYTKKSYLGSLDNYETLLSCRENCEIEKLLSEKSDLKFISKNGIFIAITKEGLGDSLKKNDQVVLSYKAFFTDGRKFDDTELWEDSLKFFYGQPFQILPGIDAAIEHLREGCEAKIIIPSHLAFGSKGSSSGLIPPFEPLLYELKIISITKEQL